MKLELFAALKSYNPKGKLYSYFRRHVPHDCFSVSIERNITAQTLNISLSNCALCIMCDSTPSGIEHIAPNSVILSITNELLDHLHRGYESFFINGLYSDLDDMYERLIVKMCSNIKNHSLKSIAKYHYYKNVYDGQCANYVTVY